MWQKLRTAEVKDIKMKGKELENLVFMNFKISVIFYDIVL